MQIGLSLAAVPVVGQPPVAEPIPVGPLAPGLIQPAADAAFDGQGGWSSASGVSYANGALAIAAPTASVSVSHALSVVPALNDTVVYVADVPAAFASGNLTFQISTGSTHQSVGTAVSAQRRVVRVALAGAADRGQARLLFGGTAQGTLHAVQAYNIQPAVAGRCDIFAAAGQSNIGGASSTTGYSYDTDVPELRALYQPCITNGAFGALTDGTGPAINPALTSANGIGVPYFACEPLQQGAANTTFGVSPVTSIVTGLVDGGAKPAGGNLCLIGAAVGGTSATLHWAPPVTRPAGRGELYDLLRANITAGLARNGANRFRGLFWCQGESNTAAELAQATHSIFTALRAEFGLFPIVILEIGYDVAGAASRTAEQAKLVTGSGHALELPLVAFVPRPAGWTLEPDGIHYTAATQRQRGRDAAAAMLAML